MHEADEISGRVAWWNGFHSSVRSHGAKVPGSVHDGVSFEATLQLSRFLEVANHLNVPVSQQHSKLLKLYLKPSKYKTALLAFLIR